MLDAAPRQFYPDGGKPARPLRPYCVACRARGGRPWHCNDPAHFDLTVRPHLSRTVRAAERLLGSEDLAWDAAQEALLSLWNTPEKPTNLAAWLAKTARHRALHLQRTRTRSRRRERRVAWDRPEESRQQGPGAACEQCELVRKVEEALDRLPREQGEAFRLCELEELDYQDAADRLGVPVGTIRSRLHRARASLREALAWAWGDAAESSPRPAAGRPKSRKKLQPVWN
jgi:RNA polymerase sigma-70 factor (ECF subfamily)